MAKSQNKTKQNKTKQNKTKQNKTKQNKTMLPNFIITNIISNCAYLFLIQHIFIMCSNRKHYCY